MNKTRSFLAKAYKPDDAENGVLRFVITTDTVDSYGDIVKASGFMNLKALNAGNGVPLQLDHSLSTMANIGRAVNFKKVGKTIISLQKNSNN